MEGIIFTQLSISEIRAIIREEVSSVLEKRNINEVAEKEQERIITFQEACDFLKIAAPTLYKYTSKSMIPHIKKGRKLYFNKSTLIDWLKSGEKKSISDIEKQVDYFLKKGRNIKS